MLLALRKNRGYRNNRGAQHRACRAWRETRSTHLGAGALAAYTGGIEREIGGRREEAASAT